MTQQPKYAASVSFGKDSAAMLLKIIEKGMPLDKVVFYDTGAEFQAIYNVRDQLLPAIREYGAEYVELKPKRSFFYDMLEKPVKCRNGETKIGYKWCGGACRWGTAAKVAALDRETKGFFVYVGIAADEAHRIAKEREASKLLPLVDFGMSEADCLAHCREKGISWEESGIDLYGVLDRVSCWCCRNKNLKELRGIYENLPEYWNKLVSLETQIGESMKASATLPMLAAVWDEDNKQMKLF